MGNSKYPDGPPGSGLVGLALYGLAGVGICSAIAATVALSTSEYAGAGVLALASAVSFGLLLNALLRT